MYIICEHYFIVITTDIEVQYILYYISPLIFVDAFRYYLFKNSLLVDHCKSTITIDACLPLMGKITYTEISYAQSFIPGVFYISHIPNAKFALGFYVIKTNFTHTMHSWLLDFTLM